MNIDIKQIDFTKLDGLVPVVVQDSNTLQVLMVGFMNEEAFNLTLSSGKVTFYSRTKQRIWQKGETSGHFLNVVDMFLDCDEDSILIMANPVGPTCHTGSVSCFQGHDIPALGYIGYLNKIISERILDPQDGSYTNKLMSKGLNKIAQKVGEEGVEVVIAALAESRDDYLGEMTDLIYHMLVLMHAKKVSIHDIAEIIKQRHESKNRK